MGDDAGAGLQFPGKLLLDVAQHARQEIQGDDGGLADIRLEEVALDELHAIGDAHLLRVLVGELDELGIDVDAHAALGLVLRNRRRDEAAVAGA